MRPEVVVQMIIPVYMVDGHIVGQIFLEHGVFNTVCGLSMGYRDGPASLFPLSISPNEVNPHVCPKCRDGYNSRVATLFPRVAGL